MLKKRFYNDKKEPHFAQRFFIGYYSFIYYIILQKVVVIILLFIKLLISHFNLKN